MMASMPMLRSMEGMFITFKHFLVATYTWFWHNPSRPELHNRKDGKLSFKQFAKSYNLFENKTSAVIFVVKDRITQDKDLMSMAVDARKIFCVVRIYADNIYGMKCLNKMEESIRKDQKMLCLIRRPRSCPPIALAAAKIATFY
ncbi:hypothetical protein O6H91_09G013900 [Diphasiastrum complanatum]|uniref:Uncharacterized protein n=1 Tax=Diphasiastrum complanatum TaxID=34168 RepID=A0ACC2CLI7_DIPCM|nr:hypothetical protein O6H91_09G013900 [Diphasiastrum complanatum]